jgi:hypothetical protein
MAKLLSDDEVFGTGAPTRLLSDEEVFTPRNNSKPTLGDYTKGFASGANQMVSGIGYLAENAGATNVGKAIREIGDTGQKYWSDSMTPAGRHAAGSQVFEDDPNSILPRLAEKPGQALAMGVAQSAPSMLAAAVPGGIASMGLRAGAAQLATRGIGGALAPLAAGTAAPVGTWSANLAGHLAARAPTALGFGGAEGAVAGATNAAQFKSQIEQMPEAELAKMSGYAELAAQVGPSAARAHIAEQGANDILWRTTAATGGIGAITGGGAMGSAFQRVTTGAKGGIAGAVLRDAGKEALQEIPQSGGERYIQNLAGRDYLDPNQSPTQGVLSDALSGGAVGAALGAVSGAGSHLVPKGPVQKALDATAGNPDGQDSGLPATSVRADASVRNLVRVAAADDDANQAAIVPGTEKSSPSEAIASPAPATGTPSDESQVADSRPPQPNTPAAPEPVSAPVSTAATSLPPNQAEPAGVPPTTTEGVSAHASQTQEAVTPAPGRKEEPAKVSGTAGVTPAPEWVAFPETSGTLGIPRSSMPQIRADHRGAMVNFMNARGVSHEQDKVPASSLRATQAEFSPAKVEKAAKLDSGDRSILVSSDNHVLDGHHQWLAKLNAGESVKVIRLKAPIKDLVRLAHEFPSSSVADGATAAPKEQLTQQPTPTKSIADLLAKRIAGYDDARLAKAAEHNNPVIRAAAKAEVGRRAASSPEIPDNSLSFVSVDMSPKSVSGTSGNPAGTSVAVNETASDAPQGPLSRADAPQPAPDAKAERLAKLAEKRAELQAKRKPSNKPRSAPIVDPEKDSLLVAIAKIGGMSTAELTSNGVDKADITKKSAGAVSKKTGRVGAGKEMPISFGFNLPLHRKFGGLTFDGVLEAMKQYGYFPEGATKNDVIDAVNAELSGKPHYTNQALQRMAEMDEEARNAEAEAEQNRIDAEAAAEAAIEQSSRDEFDYDEESPAAQDIIDLGDAFDIGAPSSISDERAFLISMGATEEEADAEIRQNQQDGAGRGEAQTGEAPATGPAASGQEDAQGRPLAGGNEAPAPGFDLAGQSPAEIAEAEAERVAAEKARKAADDRAADDRAAIKQRSEAAAITFELGGDALKNLSGQGDMFAAPPAAAKPTASPESVPAKPESVPEEVGSASDREKAAQDLKDALGDLADIFGKPFRANIVPEQEQKLFPVMVRVFDAAFRLGYHSFKDAARFVLQTIRDKISPEVADTLTIDHLQGAYIAMSGGREGASSKRDVIGVESKQEIEDAQRSGGDSERDRPAADAQRSGEDAVPDGRHGEGGQPGRPVPQTGGQRSGHDGGARLPDGGAAVAGERGDQPAHRQDGQIGPAVPAAGGDESGRSAGPGGAGVDARPGTAPAVEAVVERSAGRFTDKLEAQQAAESIKVVVGDKANIDATLPFLTAGQREDVQFAEKRWSSPDGYGVLFTNGTGTGKTFLSLGAIKRLTKQGKGNGIVVVPNEAVMNEWVKSAPALGLQITPLADTKDAGSGIAITTYANFGQNDDIAKRDYDFVTIDEAHLLMLGKEAASTEALGALRAVSLHPDGVLRRAEMQNRELVDRIASNQQRIRELLKSIANPDTMDQIVFATRKEIEALDKTLDADLKTWRAVQDRVKADVLSRQGEKRPRVMFLSATPFAYEQNIQWGQGFLYEFPEVEGRGYNSPDPYGAFMIQHFGWRMRTGRLTQPDDAVDRDLMQRQFNSWLRKQGVLSARMLDVDQDYERKFILLEGGIGQKIDEGLKWLRDTENGRYMHLYGAINDRFDYLTRSRLLEAIKAKAAIPYIRKHHAMGRKVVVFYDFNTGGGINVFNVERDLASAEAGERRPEFNLEKDGLQVPVRGQPQAHFGSSSAVKLERVTFAQLLREFVAARPDLQNIDFRQYASPLSTLTQAFPGAGVYNGMPQYKKSRLQAIRDFNDDAKPQANLLLVQKAANAGWSGHDTTGTHMRVLINLGLPTAPIEAIQQEGRIYRVGQRSDANFHYFNTGTNWERYAFGSRIARRAGTAENLAMGEQARGLREAFIQAFENSDPGYEPSAADGKGGKMGDRDLVHAITDWERAKALYFAQQKKTSRTKSAEGEDYFATPEPLGLKMVEWGGVLPGERVLEPSAGHGAIARWFPDKNDRTVIEPSLELASRLTLATDAKLINGPFENHDLVNKYDVIVMNPPFGIGGKTAVEHLDKAFRHLSEGGRVVALIPEGPAANKRFDDWMYGEKTVKAKPVGTRVGQFGEVFAGDIATVEIGGFGIAGGVKLIGKVTDFRDGKLWVRSDGSDYSTGHLLDRIKAIQPTGKRTAKVQSATNAYLRASIGLPAVTFERAGTGVKTRVVIIDKILDPARAADAHGSASREIGAGSVKELFDALENMEVVGRALPAEKLGRNQQAQMRESARKATAGATNETGRVQPEGSEATLEEVRDAQAPTDTPKLLTDAPRVSHVTRAGKTIHGVIAKSLTFAQAKTIDKFTWKKDGGYFIRLEHVVRPPSVAEQERSVYAVKEPDGITGDLFQSATQDLFAGTENALPEAAGKHFHGQRAAPRRGVRAASGPASRVLAVRQSPDEPGVYHVSTQLVTVGERALPVARINPVRGRGVVDAAKAFAYLSRHAVEHYDAIVTDKDGRPLAVVGSFKGAVTQTSVYPSTVVAELSRIDGAAHLWTAHNHPSGVAELSNADRSLSEQFARVLDGSGVEYHGLFAMANQAGSPGVVAYHHTLYDRGAVSRNLPAPHRVPIVDRELTDERGRDAAISSPTMAISVVANIAGRTPGIVFLDAQNRPVAFVPFAGEELGRLKVDGRLMRLFRAASQANAGGAIIAMPDGKVTKQQVGNVIAALSGIDIRVLDGIEYASDGSGEGRSLASAGELAGDGTVFSRADFSPLPESQRLSVGVIQQAVEQLVQPFHATQIPVRVIDTLADAGIVANPDDGVASGVTFKGRIHLIREGLADTSAVERTFWHELLHFGLRRFMTRDQYVTHLGKLYAEDAWIRNRANVWAAGEEGAALRSRGDSEAYIRARGADEALARLAEILQTEPTGYANNSVLARAKRVVSEWVAKLADFFGFHGAAQAWRGYAAQGGARDLVVSTFAKLRDGAAPSMLTTNWHYSDPAFLFAGQRSNAANQHELSRAKQLLSAGANADAVRQQTGWFKGVDDKWRFEIADEDARLQGLLMDNGRALRATSLATILDHPALFAAYPALRDMDVQITIDPDAEEMGSYHHGSPGDAATFGRAAEIRVDARTEKKALSTLLHEIQHGLQNIEGFARGGSPENMASLDHPQIRALENKISTLMASKKPGKQIAKEVAEINAKIADLRREEPHAAYRRLAGEVEARNVQARQTFSPDHRKYVSPDDTSDTDAADVIVVFNGKDAADAPFPANARRASALATVNASPADRAVFGMAAEGKSAAEILSFIGKASRRPFNRYLANALRNLGAASTITLDSQGGWQFGNTSRAQKYAAAYNPKTDSVALFTPREAERHLLHELTHAATLKAIAKGGVPAMRMRKLFLHVQRSGRLDGQYGMSNLDEFVAEAFSNPTFQQALRNVPAPVDSTLKNAWHWFVRLISRILGLPTAGRETALDRVLTEGAALMQENAARSGGDDGVRHSRDTALKFKSDIPNERWLQEKVKYAESKGRDRYGVPHMGTITGSFNGPVIVPTRVLAKLKGENGEQSAVREKDLQSLIAVMRKTGKLPLNSRGEEDAPYIEVAYDGSAWVSEGNHRIMAAQTVGMEDLPVEIRYFDGGERVGFMRVGGREFGVMNPKRFSNQLDDEIRYPLSDDPISHIRKPRTQEFRDWFDGSKVPRPVYHATRQDFSAFDTSLSDLGAHFGNLAQANKIATGMRLGNRDGTQIMPVWLSIKNPLRLKDVGSFHADGIAVQLERKGILPKGDGKRIEREIDGDWTLRKKYDPIIKAAIEAAGYDGVVYANTQEAAGDSYIAFDPTQIKSAIGNTGAFSPTNPDIRFNVAGTQPAATPPVSSGNAWQRAKAKAAEILSPKNLDKVIYELQDKYVDLRRMRDHIREIGGTITDLNDAYLGEELYHKRLAHRTQDFLKAELRPLLADMKRPRRRHAGTGILPPCSPCPGSERRDGEAQPEPGGDRRRPEKGGGGCAPTRAGTFRLPRPAAWRRRRSNRR